MEVLADLWDDAAVRAGTLILLAVLFLYATFTFVVHRRQRRRRLRLKEEYDRVVDEQVRIGSAIHSPASVTLPSAGGVRALQPMERKRYAAEWAAVQEEFVETPAAALAAADRLLVEVMRARGYPVDRDDEIPDVVAKYHPRAAVSFRAAHALSTGNRAAHATIDHMRQSFLHQRALFQELVDDVAHIDLTAHEATATGSYHRWFRGGADRQ